MTDYPVRLFAEAATIVHLGEGLLSCSLDRAEWTHEAHLAACFYLVTRRPDIDLDARIAGLIARFNESVGGVNDDRGGYHDTITRAWLAGVRAFAARHATGDLLTDVNALLTGEIGDRAWPLRFYSRDRLFSVAARRSFAAPDLAPLPVT
ncbi:hypothetical protein [Sphingomonas sp.]|uniref:hypothetical protein n=1 Tax=Sphingomonas sp. TaxID=28214 RepID=UPI001EC6342C|nr:hypothetical protein [Sphingomonas sp.]MBX3593039.1 hypothetical protein [Sphingomonas sp.]